MLARRTWVVSLAAVLLSCVAVSSAADATAARKYALPQRGSFQMNVPAGWSDELRQPQGSLPPTIAFRAREGKPFDVLVTPIWRARADVPVATKDAIKQSVQKAADEVKSQAVERTIPIVEFASSTGPGFYFSATDKAPNPGEYKYMTQGMLKVSDLTVTFTILTNDGQEQVAQDALAMLKSAVHVQP
jgi:hypothetical protein